MHPVAADTTGRGYPSAGCAVAARKGIGVTPLDLAGISPDVGARIAGGWINAVVKGGIHVFTVYLHDSEVLSERNGKIFQELAANLRSLNAPWICAGDWNMTPEGLMRSNWLSVASASIAAPQAATCNGKTYDLFVISPCLAHAVKAVQVIERPGFGPTPRQRQQARG